MALTFRGSPTRRQGYRGATPVEESPGPNDADLPGSRANLPSWSAGNDREADSVEP